MRGLSIAVLINLSKLALAALLLSSPLAMGSDYSSHKKAPILVNSRSLVKKKFGVTMYPRPRVFYIRGGGDDDTDVFDASEESPSDDMQELRKEWSSVPATPSILLPIVDTNMEENPVQSTLGDLDNDKQDKITKAIIIMDGFCPYHGQYLSHVAREVHGAAIIHVLSDFVARFLYEVEGEKDHLSSRLPDDIRTWLSLLPPSTEICGIYCESDSGLEDAEKLGAALGLHPHCHDGVNAARRDKFLMNQVVSEVGGLDTVKQKSCQTWEEALEFAKELGLDDGEDSSTLVVVKPLRGVASDDVHLCSNIFSLRKAFTKILQNPVFGSSIAAKNQQVLVQEFASGVEYAVDVVCRDGERKVAALWRYDKREVNGAPFVYHATELISADKEGIEKSVCDYVFDALDALGIRWGLSHVEVIVSSNSATGKTRVRLVEVNCRQHNTDFIPLCNACVGYNALDMILGAYLGNINDESWDSIPILPTTRAFGTIVHFVSHVEGKISKIRYDVLQEIEDLASVMDMHIYPQFMEVGNLIEKTIDIRTDTGWAHLMNNDEEEFRRDYKRLVELMKVMFEVEEENH